MKKIRFYTNVREEVRGIGQKAALNILAAIHRYALATIAYSSKRPRTPSPSITSGIDAKPIAEGLNGATPYGEGMRCHAEIAIIPQPSCQKNVRTC